MLIDLHKISLLLLCVLPVTGRAQQAVSRAVFTVDYASPTADKPQSKLWYQDACWWAVLPRAGGPSLWQRTAAGWVEHPGVYHALKGIPGRADVWHDTDGVMAVGVSRDSLAVFHLSRNNNEWQAALRAVLKTPAPENIETATIARDAAGEWWVAADGDVSVYAWHSVDGRRWSKAIRLKEGIGKDDICTIAAVDDGVMAIWSNQQEDAVQYRLHRNGHHAEDWEPQGITEAGRRTADDHLHTAPGAGGALWLVSKNSVDSLGRPQLVLRVREKNGGWKNYPYANRNAMLEPSRPVVMATPQPELMLAGHTVYHKNGNGYIEFGRLDTTQTGILVDKRIVIAPDPSLHAKVNNCTVSKAPFPADGPWIILASDEKGRVYEADLRK